MRPGFAFGERSRLITFRQANVTMAVAMDVHEHDSSDKKGILVDSRVRAFSHTRQVQNLLPQFFMKFFS